MAILLEKMGHDATFCENGQEALELLQREPYDVVLLDYHMPVLDGLATTEAIRRLDSPAAQIKIILVTADVVNDTRRRAMEVGVNEFTSKPLQAEDLQAALGRCGLLDPSGLGVLSLSVHSLPAPLPMPNFNATEPPPAAQTEPAEPADLLIDTEAFGEIVSMMPPETLTEMLKTVFDPPAGTAPELLQSLANGDREAVNHNAHKLKGTAMLLGFRALARSSALLEDQSKDPDVPMHISLGTQLRTDLERTQAALQQLEAGSVI
jgi:two-component system, sensor histidine kinase